MLADFKGLRGYSAWQIALGLAPRWPRLRTERLDFPPGGGWLFEVGGPAVERRIRSRATILCSGRFFGRGLHAKRTGIRETVFGLLVTQPARRSDWHHRDLLHGPGHPINRAGVAIDDRFRPVDDRGRPVYPDSFAAGSILAHQDWMRQKCGSGIAIATALGAVEACRALLH